MKEFFFKAITGCLLFIILISMGLMFGLTLENGFKWLNINFLTGFPSRIPSQAGILPPLAGTLWLFFLTLIIASVLGVGATIYVHEIMKEGPMKKFLITGMDAINGIPSIIFGLVAAEVAGRGLGLKNSLLTGASALAFLSLPAIFTGTRQALISLPAEIKQGMFAIGATKLQNIFMLVLPSTYGMIITGIILAMSRALGEAAPLIAVGAVAFSRYVPASPLDETTALPIQIFVWASRPEKEFLQITSATIVVLITLVLLLNITGILIRYQWRKKKVW